MKFAPAQLTNPTYNVQLGEAHLRGLIDSYSGSYFLALAAYNAGGGRVQEWMKAFGDPRDPATSIPSIGSSASLSPRPATM